MTLLQQIRAELKAIIRSVSIMSALIGGVLIYAVLYPQPYLNDVPREQRVAIIDLDSSQLSRKLIRMVDATPQVKVQQNFHSLEQVEAALKAGELVGYLVIPEDFYKDILLHRSPAISYAGDGSYFLSYGTIAEGIASASASLGAQIEVQRMAKDGMPLLVAAERHADIRLFSRPVFNPTMGYVNYVVAGILVLVLHQTLLMAVGMFGCRQIEVRCRHCTRTGKTRIVRGDASSWHLYWCYLPAWRVVLVRVICFTLIAMPLVAFYLGVCYSIYGIPHVANFKELCLFSVAFFAATSAFGIVLGELIRRPEIVSLVVLFSSMPIAFGSGFIWPTELIPHWVTGLIQWIPATSGVMGFLELNQMGADLSSLRGCWMQLWKLTAAYMFIACFLIVRRRIIDEKVATA